MLSSGMFARHQPPAPALRRGRALYVDPRSFPEKSLLCFHTLAHSFIFRIQHFSLLALCFQSLPHSFQKRGVGINSSQSGTRHSALIPLQLIQVLSFHTLAHSLAQWAQHNPFGINSFRTLSIAMGVWGVCRHLPTSPRFNVRFTPIPPPGTAARYLVTSTIPTLFTPLHARYTRPSFVAAMFRTVPPPDGIVARANACVFGSNRMSVFGFTPDSLYHTIPSGVMTIPYGADPAPPGESHNFTALVAGSSLPRCPRSKSLKYTLSSAAIASRRGRTPSGSANSVIAMVFGSIFPSLFVPNSQKNGSPRLLICIPYGRALSVCTFFSSIFPVFGFSLPTKFPTCTVNHSVPSRSNTAVCGSSAFSSGILYSVTTPVRGSSFPMYAATFPVNQILPSRSATSPCGPELSTLSGYSLNSPVAGSSRPILFASWPVYHSAPSAPTAGS